MHFYGSASAEPFFVAPFPENRGARLRISGGCPARGEPEALIDLCSSIACRVQPCQRCTPVLQALIYLSMYFYGSASAEPFFCCPFPGELGSTAENVILKGKSAAKRCVPPFFARQTVLYYNSIGACRKGSKPVRFTQGSVSRARCTEKAVF